MSKFNQTPPLKVRFELSFTCFMKTALQTSQILFISKALETDFSKVALVSLIKKDSCSYVFHAYDPKNFRFLIVKIIKKVDVNCSGEPWDGTVDRMFTRNSSKISKTDKNWFKWNWFWKIIYF